MIIVLRMKKFFAKLLKRAFELFGPKKEPKPVLKPQPIVIPVTGITLDKTSVGIKDFEHFLLNATIQPSNATNKDIDWSSSSIMIATVTHYADNPCIGSVTGLATGTAIITAKTMDGGYKATCTVKVNPDFVPVTGITLDKTTVNVSCPQGFLLKATIEPDNATNKDIDWTSSSIMIATVTHHADNPCIGSAAGIAPGTAIIKARTMDGNFEATCKVIVTSD